MYNALAYLINTILQHPSCDIASKESLPVELQDRLGDFALVGPVESLEQGSTKTALSEDWTRFEKAIRSVLSRISSVPEENILRHTTIFQLGLDSINAVQVAAMLRENGFASVTATDILENANCSKLAARLASTRPGPEEPASYDIAEFQERARQSLQPSVSDWESVEAILPCSPLQIGMLKEFLESKGRDYFNFMSLKFQKTFDQDFSLLKAAWRRLIETREILRTGFTPLDLKDASFAMLQYKPQNHAIPVSDHVDDHTFSLAAWKEKVTADVFSNIKPPPWRVAIARDSGCIQMHIAIHHAIYDAQSLQFLFTDLHSALSSRSLARRPNVATVVHDVLTQACRNKGEDKAFWEKQAPLAVINKFPVMTPLKEADTSLLVKTKTCSLPLAPLEDHVKKAGVTIQAVAQAAWLRILASYLGEHVVVFGTILSGRNSETTRNAVFPCIATLPVIGQYYPSNREALQAMMEYNIGLQRHQRTPLTDIQRWVGHPSTKLFDTLLVYQRFERNEDEERPWRVHDDQAAVDYPVSVEVEQHRDSVEFRITFASNILPVQQAKLLLEQFDAVFCALVEHPDGEDESLRSTRPGLFAILPAQEPELKSDIRFLHEFVEASAQQTPDKVALEFVSCFRDNLPVSRQWTYRELCANGNRVANILGDHVKAGDIVAVCFDKCPEAHFAMLGILKAGCAFLALDPGAPSPRKEFILQDSGASILLTDQSRSRTLDFDVAVPVVEISDNSLRDASSAHFKLSRPLQLADRSYCLYTSGTTGMPKGCEITHENAVQAMLAFQKLFDGHWDESSRWLQFASYHFDVSVLEQYWTWSVGITLFAAPRDVILEDLVGTISTLQITHIDLTPSLARLMHPDDVPSLCRGVFITGGEQLKQEILDVWGPKRVIHNFYGPTEATIGVTTFPCVPVNGKSSNIGKQFANVGSYVLRPGTEIPVLKGGVGELCVSGKLVGKGYLNREGLTAERFPTLQMYGERVYRTGDLVRVLHDGCFDFLGRADDQVKLRGQRLEIGEINHCIRSGVPEVKDVVTVVVRNEKQQKDLLATFVVTAQEDPKTGDLGVITGREAQTISGKAQRACRERLPGYMVPTYILLLPFIPLSPNNKAELKVLKALFNTLSPEQLIAPSSMVSVMELGEVGRTLRRCLSRMTDVAEEDISPASTIFELGVDSISVMRLARMLKQEGVQNATPATILRNPMLAELAQAVGGLSTDSSSIQSRNHGTLEAKLAVEACQHRHRSLVCLTLAVKADEIEYIAPCSALQQGMISRSRTKQDSEAYFNTFRFELADDVVLSKLQSAWETLMRKHSILRTRFVATTDGYIQVSLRETILPWNELTLEPDLGLDAVLGQQQRAWVGQNKPNITRPWELHVVSKDEKRWLAMHIFHGIYDATTFNLLMDEAKRLYKGEEPSIGGPSFLDALLHGPLQSSSSSKSFWVNHLKGAKSTPLLQPFETPSDKDLAVSRRIDFAALEQVRKGLGVTQQAVIQALWSLVLQQHLPTGGTTFGVIVSGRAMDLENVENTIGPLFNTIPYHYRPSKSHGTWSSIIRLCHEFNTAVLPFQHVPLRDVQKWCFGGRPVFNSLFSFQRRHDTHQKLAKGLWRECDPSLNPDYPLAFEATLNSAGVLEVLLVTQEGVADERALAALLHDFETKARTVAENPEGLCHAPDSFDVPAEEEQVRLMMGEMIETPAQRFESRFEWTSQARAIRQQIAMLSGVEETSVTESTTMLELGLDSIDTVKLSARLKRAGISLSNSELIKGQSVARLTALLSEREAQAKGSGATDSGYSSDVEEYSPAALDKYLVEVGPDLTDVEQVLPPTPLQDSMVSEMINSEFQLYFNHDVLEVSPNVDIARLKEAWSTVARNTPILRTVFVEIESQEVDFAYMQLVSKTGGLAFGEVGVGSSDEVAFVKTQARERALRGHGRSDLFQVTFVNSPQATYVVLSVAHALYDGWSLGLLHQDVEAAYKGTYSPRPAYTGYLRQLLRSSRKGAHNFWSDYISDARRTILQIQEGQLGSNNRAESWMRLPAAVLKAFCKRQAISQQALAQACWAAVLATYSRRLDVTFGVVLSGRETEASEAMLFPTMNTVPVRAVFHGSVTNFLRYMQENMTNISQFQHYPLRKIQAVAQHGQGGLFNTLFILQKGTRNIQSGEPLMKSVEGTSAVEYPVCVEMEVVSEKLLWRTACDSRCISSDRTAQLLEDIEHVLDFLVNSAEEDVLKFSDEGVSICGLAAFQPEGSHITEDSQEIQQGEDCNGVWSLVEETIRSVVAKMAGVEPASVSKHHNLYHLGLDSIRAIKVSSALRKRGVTVAVRDLIQATSIRDMAARVSEAKANPVSSFSASLLTKALDNVPVDLILASAGIQNADIAEALPATAMQTHMLSVWANTQGAVFYPEFRYQLMGVNDIQAVEKAWDRLVEQSRILRTIFLATGSDKIPFLQAVLPPKSSVKNPFVSLAIRHGHGKGSLLLRLRIHHALYDGVSLPLILRHFRALLSGQQFGSMSSEQQWLAWKSVLASTTIVDGSSSEIRQSFWAEYLRNCNSTPSFPAAYRAIRPTTADFGFSMDDNDSTDRLSILRRGAISDTAKLKELCTQHGVSMQAVFFAAYAQVLALSTPRLNNTPDVVLGIYFANRGTNGSSSQELPYPTLCLVPLRVHVEVGGAVSQLFETAARVQSDLHEISAAENVSVGLWEIQEWTGVVVDSFANFLSLPVHDEEDEGEEQGKQSLDSNKIRLEAINNDQEAVGAVFSAAGGDVDHGGVVNPNELSWVQKNAVRDAYPVSYHSFPPYSSSPFPPIVRYWNEEHVANERFLFSTGCCRCRSVVAGRWGDGYWGFWKPYTAWGKREGRD